MDINLQKQCPELLEAISSFPNDGAGTHLKEIRNAGMYAHKNLRAALGWEPDMVRIESTLSSTISGMDMSCDMVVHLLKDKDAAYIIDNGYAPLLNNRMESGIKASKVLKKESESAEFMHRLVTYVNTFDKPIDVEYNSSMIDDNSKEEVFFYHLNKELPKLNMNSVFTLYNQFDVFIQNFFSELAVRAGALVGFSIDMLDFIKASNSSAFSSCYSIPRQHNSAAPISISMSPNSGMIYIATSKGKISGRAWVFFSNDFSSFIVLKSYGFINMSTITTVCAWLCNSLDANAVWYKTSTVSNVRIPRNAISVNGFYPDPIILMYSKEVKDTVPVFTATVDATVSPCIICGKAVCSNTLICGECDDKLIAKCLKCGHLIFKNTDGRSYLCDKCITHTSTCPTCGANMHDGVCDVCLWQTKCTLCGSSDDIVKTSIGNICRKCSIGLMHGVCSACGEVHLTYPYKGIPLCSTCYLVASSLNEVTFLNHVRESCLLDNDKAKATMIKIAAIIGVSEVDLLTAIGEKP